MTTSSVFNPFLKNFGHPKYAESTNFFCKIYYHNLLGDHLSWFFYTPYILNEYTIFVWFSNPTTWLQKTWLSSGDHNWWILPSEKVLLSVQQKYYVDDDLWSVYQWWSYQGEGLHKRKGIYTRLLSGLATSRLYLWCFATSAL